jgi:anthranilate synthase component 1
MLEFLPSREEYAVLAGQANTVPVYCSLLSDHLTPVSAFERLAGDAEHAFLLESVIGGEKIARYSFLATDPIAVVESHDRRTVIRRGSQEEVFEDADPLERLEALLDAYQGTHPPALPRFVGGAVGYAGYDIARHYEKLENAPTDDRQLPDLLFGLYDRMVIFDHVRKLIHVLAHARVPAGSTDRRMLSTAYDAACHRIEETVAKLTAAPAEPAQHVTVWARRPEANTTPGTDYDSNFSREEFEGVVDRCKEYIRAGDIFQVVVSQRLTATSEVPPFDIYRALRVIDPSPFMFFMKSPQVTLVGSSPEILCRLEGRTVTSRPLAGTRPRGRNEAEDRGYEAELLADPKERAEHVMLVDLGRNDLGRVCTPGSVEVTELMAVERYSHVMHICSNVIGQLAPDKTALDALRCVLPVGTVSGAPKIRAMEIIDEMETVRRGPYAGALGYIDFDGNMDTCITLRTLVITDREDGKRNVHAQVGAGIVADSQPDVEYQETLNKAKSMLGAIEVAAAWHRQRR